MKERFLLAVSWGALAWALFVCWAVWNAVVVDGRSLSRVLGSDDGFIIFISPAVWTVLWIVTGSPRILPWRK